MARPRQLLRWLGGIAFVMACLGFGLRFLDGPLFVLHGGPLRSGDYVGYADVDWRSLDGLREMELELAGTGRSLLLWFSVTDGRPYISCGFGCDDGFLTRWPRQVEQDPRVVVRLDGMRIRARAEQVPHGSEEHDVARADRHAKFSAGEDSRARAELGAHNAIVKLGSELSDDEAAGPSSRLFRIVPP